MRTWSYSAYGLGIRSEIELAELLESGSGDDIIIRLGHVEPPDEGNPPTDDYIRLGREDLAFHTPYGRFRITSARELTVEPLPGISPTALRLTILGRALGAMLQWRGRFVLHASAVARDGRVVAFTGDSGAGKSTTAAALLADGWELVGDDLAAIAVDRTPPLVHPAFPQIKLWHDASDALGIDASGFERVDARIDKRMIPLAPERLVDAALPLDTVYVLDAGAPTRVESLDPQAALVELLRHSYAPRIMRALGRQGEHMAQCARLVAKVRVCRLVVDRSAHDRRAIVAAIAHDLAR